MIINNLKTKAIGLVEILLVLTVISLITIVSVRYFIVAKRTAKVTTAIGMVGDVVEASYTWVRGQPNFANISMVVLTTGGYLPAKLGAGIKANPWGGNLLVTGINSNTQIQVTLTGIENSTANSCNNLKMKLSQKAVTGTCTVAGTTATYQGTF